MDDKLTMLKKAFVKGQAFGRVHDPKSPIEDACPYRKNEFVLAWFSGFEYAKGDRSRDQINHLLLDENGEAPSRGGSGADDPSG